jgi:hypothetical protein
MLPRLNPNPCHASSYEDNGGRDANRVAAHDRLPTFAIVRHPKSNCLNIVCRYNHARRRRSTKNNQKQSVWSQCKGSARGPRWMNNHERWMNMIRTASPFQPELGCCCGSIHTTFVTILHAGRRETFRVSNSIFHCADYVRPALAGNKIVCPWPRSLDCSKQRTRCPIFPSLRFD